MDTDPLSFLVVDDDIGDRMLISRLLRSSFAEAEIHEATSIAEAQDLLGANRIDLIFLDFLLPGVDGLAGLAALSARYPGTALVMITGQGDEHVAAQAIKCGAADYIAKNQLSRSSVQRIVGSALETVRLRRQIDEYHEELRVFASALIHDVRAPIRNLEFLCSELKDSITAGDQAQALSDVDDIQLLSVRLNGLLTALAQHVRLGDETEIAVVDMEAVVRDTLADLALVIRERDAVVETGDLPPVMGCAAQLSRLIQNLVANGIKYCRDRRPHVRIFAESVGETSIVFAVADNGIGIDEAFQAAIFEPFRRLHGDDEFEGTGLGLATCNKIVKQQGGRMWCRSTPGEGSTFYFTLPAARSGQGGDAEQDAARYAT